MMPNTVSTPSASSICTTRSPPSILVISFLFCAQPLVARRRVDGVPAGVFVAGSVGRPERRLLDPAPIACVRAAGREAATRRDMKEIGWPSLDHLEAGVTGLRQLRDRVQQRLGVGHAHVGEERAGGGPLHDPSCVHHRDLVGARRHDPEVVRHEDHRHVPLALLRLEEIEDLGLDGHVERGGGLVGEQQLRAAGERHGDHHPLTHPARELVRVLAQPALGFGYADRAQQRKRALASAVARHVEVLVDRFGDLVPDTHDRVQRVHRVLEHHRHLSAPIGPHLPGRQPGDLPTLEADRAVLLDAAARQQPDDRVGEHRLAGARLADQAQGPAPVEGERHAVDRAVPDPRV